MVWTHADMQQWWQDDLPCESVVLLEVDSTSAWLKQQRPEKATLVVAYSQTAGYGQQGRSWGMRPGRDLVFSLWLPDASGIEDFATLTPWLAFQLRAALQPLSEDALTCKWPNDLYNPAGKVSGTLVERQGRGLIVGTGINWLRTQHHPYALAKEHLPEHWLADWTAFLLHKLPTYQRGQWLNVQPQWAAVDWFRQDEAVVDQCGRRWTYVGVDELGRICLQQQGERHCFATGKISLKRV
ncbi:birA, biotin-[acetyl-CoA-carboxylase] ligase region [Sulfurivirga caldicuralii]|uniref:BirA, biotin-[acetyl-CoA-carboxylase] ligase region n=1 Tax=Sulfurivirga caldicuralii TaxID=364032 RepID=A0A1N6DI51_9GAMM|nr:biotin--[acetyl-CoA-carboxylase] ligase [Sulfurivirga caldicuralii]SIN70462.1 birA, biotin-[acetyl-CoA-carboxylase] ligase region [Sulfurivirga caldicuralii]